MAIEDWGYRWLKRYMDAPAWVKEPLGRLYGLLPDRLRHGKDYPRYRAEAALSSPAEIKQLADERLRETLRWAAGTVPAYAALTARLLTDMPASEWLALFPLMTKLDYKRAPENYLSTACTAADRLPGDGRQGQDPQVGREPADEARHHLEQAADDERGALPHTVDEDPDRHRADELGNRDDRHEERRHAHRGAEFASRQRDHRHDRPVADRADQTGAVGRQRDPPPTERQVGGRGHGG